MSDRKKTVDIWKNSSDFKEAIGGFIIAFSELEFGLAFLCCLTEFDVRNKDSHLVKYMGLSFEQKVKTLSEFIAEQMTEVEPIWTTLKNEIGQLNRERRFLTHGFMKYYLPRDTITTHVKEKGQAVTKNQTLEEIKSYTNRLHHLNTGKNGIRGEFHNLFMKVRIDKWNNMVNDDHKIIFSLNSEIVSEWKGESKV